MFAMLLKMIVSGLAGVGAFYLFMSTISLLTDLCGVAMLWPIVIASAALWAWVFMHAMGALARL